VPVRARVVPDVADQRAPTAPRVASAVALQASDQGEHGLRQGPAKPSTAVRFRSPPPAIFAARLQVRGPFRGARACPLVTAQHPSKPHHLERFASPGPDGLVFPNAAGNPIAATRRASGTTTLPGHSGHRACRAGSTIFCTAASPWLSPQVPIPKRSRYEWVTRRSTSPSTATATSFPSWTKPSPPPSLIAYRLLGPVESPGSSTRLLAGNETGQSRAGCWSPTD
jgi:hypothetical protein